MKKLIFTSIAILGLTTLLSAQYVDQSLMFSQQNYGTTARSKAMGGAFGALGGDFSSLSINPAGIAIYQRSEISASINVLNQNNTETTYQGQMGEDRSNKFNFSNFGYVSSTPQLSENSSGLKSINFGFGFNRLNNFNQNILTNADNSTHSRMDAFAQNTNGTSYNNLVTTDNYDPYYNGVPWESKLAWENYLIDVTNSDAGGNQYASILFENELVNQLEMISREGFVNEYVGSFGLNFNHQFYLGATLGIQDLYFDEAKTYHEDGLWGTFDYTNRATTSGVGYNFKLGAIFRPIPELRLGAAIHTPTFYTLDESYSSVMSSTLQDVGGDADGSHREETPIGHYSYKTETPMRAIGSIALQFAKRGLISFDYEYVDYSNIKLRKGEDGYAFSPENQEMKEIYQAVNNFRFGAEYRVVNNLSLRGGVELLGNPYNSNAYNTAQPNRDYKFSTYSGGIGYRNKNLSFDIAYSLGDRTNYGYIYQLDNVTVDPVKYHSLMHEVMFTLGIKL